MTLPEMQKNHDKLLFTPGPLTTAMKVKEAALVDLGSRDSIFISIVQKIRQNY
jgi:2-aminoethylphosphonate-pyruvate transaminase